MPIQSGFKRIVKMQLVEDYYLFYPMMEAENEECLR